MKNFIYNGIHSKVSKDLIKSFSNALKPKNLVCISSLDEKNFSMNDCENFINIRYSDAIYGQYDQNNSAIDDELLRSLAPYLFTTLKMMERNSPELVYSFDDRLKIYHSQVRFWNDIIEKHQIECFIGINYPHEIYDYIIYTLCKVKKIKTLFFCQTQVNGYIQLISDIEENDLALKINPASLSHIEMSSLSPIMQQHFDSQSENYAAPFYMEINQNQLKKDFSLASKLKKITSPLQKIFKKLLEVKPIPLPKIASHFFFTFKFGTPAEKNLIKAYEQISQVPDLAKSFFYLPLHFQPECTTCPQGGHFVNQELMIDVVLKSLPENVFLYVKEHPFQRPHGRSPDFYEHFANHKNLVFIKKSFDSQILIKHSKGVITVTGTAGWEALFKKKNVLLFGNIFFQYAPGVFQVNSVASCHKAIESCLSGKNAPTGQDMINYLHHLEQHLIRGWIDELYSKHSAISFDENLAHLKDSLLNKTL